MYARDTYSEVGEQPRPLCERLRTQVHTDATNTGTPLTSLPLFTEPAKEKEKTRDKKCLLLSPLSFFTRFFRLRIVHEVYKCTQGKADMSINF